MVKHNPVSRPPASSSLTTQASCTTYQKADGVQNKAVQLLGIKRTTLIEKLKRHSLPSPR
jgi:DNA-binding NtrC family response regulator